MTEMEIIWGIDEPDQASSPPDPPAQVEAAGDRELRFAELGVEVALLREQVMKWKKKAEDWECRAVLHKRHLADIKAAKLEQRGSSSSRRPSRRSPG